MQNLYDTKENLQMPLDTIYVNANLVETLWLSEQRWYSI